MKDTNTLTAQEQKQADLAAKYEAGSLGSTDNVDDKKKNRSRAAKDWVNHFFQVTKIVNQAKEDGLSFKTEEELTAHIVAGWEGTAEEKDTAVSALFAA